MRQALLLVLLAVSACGVTTPFTPAQPADPANPANPEGITRVGFPRVSGRAGRDWSRDYAFGLPASIFEMNSVTSCRWRVSSRELSTSRCAACSARSTAWPRTSAMALAFSS